MRPRPPAGRRPGHRIAAGREAELFARPENAAVAELGNAFVRGFGDRVAFTDH